MLNNVRAELVSNKEAEQAQYNYQKTILKAIGSALKTPSFLQKIVSDNEFHLEYIAPEGVVNRDLTTVAWEIAKGHNITSKDSFPLMS